MNYPLLCIGLFISQSLSTAWAEEVSIQASFKPDSAQPQLNKFTNDTPPSGYCAANPSQCEINGMFSLRVPITFSSSGPIRAYHTDQRQGAMFKVQVQWRELTVVHESTGEQQKVSVRISGIGTSYVTENVLSLVGGGTDVRVAHNQLWGLSWVNAPAPCGYSGVGNYGNNWYGFFWKTRLEGTCAKLARFDIPWLNYSALDFAYELITPNPLGMSSGKYVGSMTYTVGPNGDLDMGDVMLPSSSALSLNFILDVQHTLKVEVPPGGNRVELVPQGGWQAWLQRNRKPERLFRDQTFNLSASSRFKMRLDCQYGDGGNTCMLYEPNSGGAVPVDIAVTLPSSMTDAAGQAVNRRPLLRDGSGTELFQPGHYIDRKPGTLHFEIARPAVEEMLTGPAKTYSGNVTVIWDSEI